MRKSDIPRDILAYRRVYYKYTVTIFADAKFDDTNVHTMYLIVILPYVTRTKAHVLTDPIGGNRHAEPKP